MFSKLRSTNQVIYPWSQQKLTSSNTFPRFGHSSNQLAPNGDIYIFGGLVKEKKRNDMHVFDTNTCHTSSISTTGDIPSPRLGHSSNLSGHVFIVFGGDSRSKESDLQDDNLYLLNLSSRKWTRPNIPGPRPTGRRGHTACIIGWRLYIFGGQADGNYFNDLVSFDLHSLKTSTLRWDFIQPITEPPKPRSGHTMVVYQEKLYIFGGTDGKNHFNDTWMYDPRANIWQELECIGYIPVPRDGHAATLVDDVVYIFGGRSVDGKDLGDLAAFKISNQRWYMFQNMGPCPSGRSGHTIAASKERIFVLGGDSFSSTKGDDPSIMFVLDTSKIKYPADVPGTKPPQNPPPRQIARKISNQHMYSLQQNDSSSGLPYQRRTQGELPNETKVAMRSQSPMNVHPDDEALYRRQRSTSPTGQISYQPSVPAMQGQSPTSITRKLSDSQQSGQQSASHQQSLNGYSNGPAAPQLISNAFISNVNGRSDGNGEFINDGRSSRQDNKRYPQSNQNVYEARSDPMRSLSPVNRIPMPGSLNDDSRGSPPKTADNVITKQLYETDIHSISSQPGPLLKTVKPPNDAFYYPQQGGLTETPPNGNVLGHAEIGGMNGEKTPIGDLLQQKDAQISLMKRKQTWLNAQLSLAQKNGFVMNSSLSDVSDDKSMSNDEKEEHDFEVGEIGSDKYKIVQTILHLKQDLRRAKVGLANQAQAASQRIIDAENARATAVQEAAYLKAKVAALQANSASEFMRVESSRTSELERRLAEVMNERSSLRDKAEALADALAHEKTAHELTRQHAAENSLRAKTAEESHSQALEDLASLHARANVSEESVREHAGRLSEAMLLVQKHEAEAADLKLVLDTLQSTKSDHQKTLEETNTALIASNNRADEAEALWKQARQEVVQLEKETTKLKSELDITKREVEIAEDRADEMERLWVKSKEEAEAARNAIRGGMEEIINKNRDITASGKVTDASTLSRVVQLQDELSNMRKLHRVASDSASNAQSSLSEAMTRIAQLEAVAVRNRGEVSMIREKLSSAMEQHLEMHDLASKKEQEKLVALRKAEILEIRVKAIKDFAADHGVLIDDDVLAQADGSQNSQSQQVQNLENLLHEKDQRLAKLESAHSTAVAELSRLQSAQADVDSRAHVLQIEVERLQALQLSAKGSVPAEERLDLEEKVKVLELELNESNESYQQKMQQLEGEYQTAVHYVKRTERMMRLMKEELNKHKAESTQLAANLETTQKEKEQLQRTLQDKSVDGESGILNPASDHDGQITELQATVDRLEKNLVSTQHELEETLQLNESLNQELNVALRKSPNMVKEQARTQGQLPSDNLGWQEERSQIQTELDRSMEACQRLETENQVLEQRAVEAENKVSLLLDQMERSVDTYQNVTVRSVNGSELKSLLPESKTVDRNSKVLDSLAHELDAIESQWESSRDLSIPISGSRKDDHGQ